jgi:hypothetical protein
MAAAPEDGALVLPVLTETTAFAFVIAHGADAVAVIELPGLNHRAVDEHLWGKEGWLGVYFGYFHRRGSKATAALTTAEARFAKRKSSFPNGEPEVRIHLPPAASLLRTR